jgi:hypothetical protein
LIWFIDKNEELAKKYNTIFGGKCLLKIKYTGVRLQSFTTALYYILGSFFLPPSLVN